MTRVFLTSDLHLGHQKVAETRGFETTAAHDQWVIESWINTVEEQDTVIVLGDIATGNPAEALKIVKNLPGTKDLITGNHDKCDPSQRGSRNWVATYMETFRSVQQHLTFYSEGQRILASHYPYEGDHTVEQRYSEYRLPDKGHWLFHGHVHKDWKFNGRQINVGIDVWGKPVDLMTLRKHISSFAE